MISVKAFLQKLTDERCSSGEFCCSEASHAGTPAFGPGSNQAFSGLPGLHAGFPAELRAVLGNELLESAAEQTVHVALHLSLRERPTGLYHLAIFDAERASDDASRVRPLHPTRQRSGE